MENREFYIDDHGIGLHAKLEFPKEEKDKYDLVIVAHGFTGHMEEEHIVAVANAVVQAGKAALRFEFYGHGKSGGDFSDHDLFKWILNYIAVIDYARKQPFVKDIYLCGHSQGGLATMIAGAMEEDRIKAIIPLAPAAMIPDYARTGKLVGLNYNPDDMPEELDVFGQAKLNSNYARVAKTIYVEEIVKDFKKPVLLVHGDIDQAVPLEVSKKFEKIYENARLVVVPNNDHCFENDVDKVCMAVRDFLAEIG